MRTSPLSLWLLAGALLGGFLTGDSTLQPSWLVGILGGLGGGGVGAVAGWVTTRPWRQPWPLVAAVALFTLGMSLLWAAGR